MNFQRSIIAVCLALCVGEPATAQVNIETRRSQAEPGLWHHHIGLKAGLRAGSVDRREFGLDLRTEYEGHRRSWFVLVDGELGWQDGQRYSNQGLTHLRLTQRLGGRLAIEAFAQFDHARQRRLVGRGLLGSGLRWQQSPSWRIGSGLMLEAEANDLPLAATHPQDTRHLRWTSYVSGSVPVGSGHLSFTTYLQPRVLTLSDLRALGDARLQAPLSPRTSLELSLRIRHDSRPVDGVDELDLRLAGGVSVNL